MRSQRVLLGLLAVIAAGVVVIAVMLVMERTDEDRTHTAAWQKAEREVRNTAESICAEGGPVDTSDERDCIEQHVEIHMADWEAEHPDDVWQ